MRKEFRMTHFQNNRPNLILCALIANFCQTFQRCLHSLWRSSLLSPLYLVGGSIGRTIGMHSGCSWYCQSYAADPTLEHQIYLVKHFVGLDMLENRRIQSR